MGERDHLPPLLNVSDGYFPLTLHIDLDFAPGPESLEVRLFTEAEIPWDEIAFRPVKFSLEHYFADRRAGRFGFHIGEIVTRCDHVALHSTAVFG